MQTMALRKEANRAEANKRSPGGKTSEDAKNPVAIAFGRRLLEVREKEGVSQDELADISSVHRTEISLLERGGREPRLGIIVKLATALNKKPSALVDGILDYEPPSQEEWRAYYWQDKESKRRSTKPNGHFTILDRKGG